MSSLRSRKLRAFIAAIVVVFAATIALAAPAAAGTCQGSSCTGRWPDGTTCAGDAVTKRSTNLNGRLIELRYSPSCRAAWGRISYARVGDGVQVNNSNGASYYQQVQSGADTHTKMVNDMNITAYACGFVGSSYACAWPPY